MVHCPSIEKFPLLSRVQATMELSRAVKRHAMSWIASVTIWLMLEKSGGFTPGTPPNGAGAGPISHLAALPLPIARLTRTWRSPRLLPVGWQAPLQLVAARRPEEPGRPSTTNKKLPLLLRKMVRPLLSTSGVGVGVCAHTNSQQNSQPSCAMAPK